MSASVVDGYNVADLDFRQAPLDGEFVVVFAQTAGDIIPFILFFSKGNKLVKYVQLSDIAIL